MSSEPIPTPKPRRLLLGGVLATVIACAMVYTGISTRAKNEELLVRWTNERAIPTVALVKPIVGAKDRELVLPGNIQANATALLYARATGYVKAWNVDIGAKVTKGQVLAILEAPEIDQQLLQAKADLANAVAAERLAAITADRWRQLQVKGAVSNQDLDQKESDATSKRAATQSAQANVARLEALESFKTITAPFDGIVTQRNTDLGALVNAGAGTALFQVADLRKVRVYVRVPQAFLGDMQPGLKARLNLPQYPDQSFDSELVTTSNSVAEDSRTALVELQAKNPADKLWPGSFTEVHFQITGNPNALRVPSTALIFGEHGMQVATVDADDRVFMKNVQLGRDLGEDVEIMSGLLATDQLVDNPTETLGNGAIVHVAGDRLPLSAGKISTTATPVITKVE